MRTNVIPINSPETEYMNLTGTVKGIAEDSVMIDTRIGVINATVAFSCLVAPEPGDQVLAGRSDRSCYILAVLERPTGPDMRLDFPGNVSLKAADGRMDIASGRGLNLLSARKTTMTAPETSLTGSRINITAGNLFTCAGEMVTHARRAGLFADAVDVVAGRVTQRAGNVMRWVENIETLHIGSLVQHVRKAMLNHSAHTSITASKDVRINGERIHMG